MGDAERGVGGLAGGVRRAVLAGALALSAASGVAAQTAPASEPDHLAVLQRPSPEHVADSPYGRLVVQRLAAHWRKSADAACVARRKLDTAAFEAGARTVLIAVVERLRTHHDGVIGDGAAAAFRKRAGEDAQARLAALLADETVDRFLGMLADRDSGELARDALEHITRALLMAGLASDDDTSALTLGDDLIHQTMLRLNTAIDDFLEANRSPEMTELRELQEAGRAAIEGAIDQSRLLAFDSASLGEVVVPPVRELCR